MITSEKDNCVITDNVKEKKMYERIAIPIYWNSSSITNIELKNWKQLNDQYLSEGWEIERVDKLDSYAYPVLMYILRKEKKEES